MELVLQRSVSQRGTVEGSFSEHNAGDSSPTIPIPQGAGAFLSPEAWLPLPAVPVGGLASHRPPWSWTSCIPVAWRGAQKGRTKVPPAVLQLQVLFGRSWAAPPGLEQPCAPPGSNQNLLGEVRAPSFPSTP